MKTRISQILLALAITSALQEIAVAQLTIDDFSTGRYQKTLPTKTKVMDINVQKGNMIGGERETQYLVCHQVPCNADENEFGQVASFQIGPSKKPGVSAVAFGSGYKIYPRLDIYYGVNGPDIVPLHLDLTPYDRLRVSFDGLNSVSNFNIELFTATSGTISGCNLSSPTGSLPFTVDLPLADFTGIELNDIAYIDMISQSGGVGSLGTLGFAITKFEAILKGDTSKATIPCRPVGPGQPGDSPKVGPDFSLTTTPIIFRHEAVAYKVALAPSNGFNGTVALSCTSPQVTQCSVSPASIAGNGTAILSLSSDFAGTYLVALKGTSGNLIHSKQVAITVPCSTNPCE